ncbi:hypothetical protein K435DRAFT_752483 [Dendrothele bispora CBS 962.96]|uniref:F-box domain-containing protein n=1 Tax=Dendrothele bispora (strain CBS 962.96) TaxID=1314807 RepID=A0A4S8MAA3_DENBC|nr:hypothetical protein K435DRAFT_752483 [Dendrothele bispora CBS 962.96]
MRPQNTNPGSASVHCKKSSVLDTLRANFGIYTSDVTYASQCLIDAERDAQRCDDEIKRLEADIVVLRDQQQRIYCRIDQYRSLLAPIRKLPPEVLGRIFRLICFENSVAVKIDCPAIHLSHVCAGWRDLAQTTPSLWSRISIDLFQSLHDLSQVRSMLTTCLVLSKPSPLFLHLTIIGETKVADSVLRSVVHHCARWAKVRLDIDASHFDKLSPIKGNLPLLHSLEVRTIDDFGLFLALDSPGSLDFFSPAPQLRAVAIGKTYPTHVTMDTSTLPWGQISDLKLHFFDNFGHVNDLLLLAVQARSVTLSRCIMKDPPSNIPENFTHTLESLSFILHEDAPDPSQCFRVWTMPRLNHLHFLIRETDYLSDSYTFAELPWFIRRSGCTITTLSLVNLRLSEVEVIALFQCMTSLADLTLHEHRADKRNLSLTPSLLQKMTVDHRTTSSSRFLPHLKKVDFRIHFPFSTVDLVSMVHSRWIPDDIDAAEMGVDCLGVVKIQVLVRGDPPTDPPLRPLLAMKARGLQCMVSLDMLG